MQTSLFLNYISMYSIRTISSNALNIGYLISIRRWRGLIGVGVKQQFVDYGGNIGGSESQCCD